MEKKDIKLLITGGIALFMTGKVLLAKLRNRSRTLELN